MALLSHSCQIVDKSSLPYHLEPQQKPSPPGHTQRSLRKASRQLEVKSVWVRDQAASPSREPLTLLATCASSILGCLCHLFPAAGIWVPPTPPSFTLEPCEVFSFWFASIIYTAVGAFPADSCLYQLLPTLDCAWGLTQTLAPVSPCLFLCFKAPETGYCLVCVRYRWVDTMVSLVSIGTQLSLF